MIKLFNRIFFTNDTTPALNATNLNAMSKAIDDIDNRVIELANSTFGDMMASVYDPNRDISQAGGIAAYIDDVITDAFSASY